MPSQHYSKIVTLHKIFLRYSNNYYNIYIHNIPNPYMFI